MLNRYFFAPLVALLLLALLPQRACAGTPVLTLQATVPAGAGAVDVTAFVDQIELLDAATGAVVASAVPNAGFETTGSLGTGSFGYNPTGASWAFTARSGIATNGSGFNSPAAPEGTHVAFIQTNSSGAGSLSQTLPGLPAGLYQLRLRLAQRNTTLANQGVQVLIDGRSVGSFTPANNGSFRSYTSTAFAVDGLLRFEGTGSPSSPGADVTAFLDQVELVNTATGAVVASAVPNAGFETFAALGNGSFGYAPAGAGWAFSPSAGIASNASAFGNPAASPEGTHVALLQSNGSGNGRLEQALPSLPGGTYQVRVQAAQRSYGPSDQGVRVWINGLLINTINPQVSGFQSYLSAPFTIGQPAAISSFAPASGAAGTSVTIAGTNLAGATDVTINGVPGNITANTATSLTFTVGAAATTGRIVVNTPNGPASSSARFVVPAATRFFEVADTVSTPANGGYTPLARSDDSYYEIPLGFSFNFEGKVYTSCFIGTNGVVSFGAGMNSYSPRAFPFATAGGQPSTPLLAPYFADVDTRYYGGRVWYKLYPDRLVVLWNRVCYYGYTGQNQGTAANPVYPTNTFEVIIRRNTVAPLPAADVTFAYGIMQWTNGVATNYGTPARVGYDAGDGVHYANAGIYTDANGQTVTNHANGNSYTMLALSSLKLNVSGVASAAPAYYDWRNEVPFRNPPSLSFMPIAAYSPLPAGVGQEATVTGTGLAGVTKAVVNGADATPSLSRNTAAGFTFRVPPAATLTGLNTFSTAGGTVLNDSFTLLPAPGNALALAGANDYATTPHHAVFDLPAALTLEAWIRTSSPSEQYIITKSEDAWYLGLNALGAAPGRASFYLNGPSAAGGWLYGTSTLSDGHWHHVAGTYDGLTLSLYVDGKLESSLPASGPVATGTAPVLLGSRPGKPAWNGALDEIRIWRAARTPAEILAGLYAVPALPQASLAAYFNFDRGLPGGDNQPYGSCHEVVSGLPVTLANVALTGLTSNWVESYALVVPPLPVAAAVTPTSFTVSWQRPAVGTVMGFVVDVSTSANFAASTSFAVASPTATAQAVAGLTAGTRYYFRVRADRTVFYSQVSGQGAYATGSVQLPTTAASCGATATSFSPTSGNIGTTVTITGAGLGAATGVMFGGVPATSFSIVSATRITAVVPPGAASGSIGIVTSCGSTSTSASFTVNALTIAQVVPAAELPGQTITLTGTNFVPGSTVSFGGVPAAGGAYLSATSITAVVPGSVGSNTVTVTTPTGISTTAAFTQLAVADSYSDAGVCAAAPAVPTTPDSNWHYLLNNAGQVVLAYNAQGRNLGQVGVELFRTNPAQAVRFDTRSRAYLGRNWHLTTNAGPFTGSAVKVRFYGLISEFSQLQAAAPAAVGSLSSLRLTQYSGTAEDCVLSNNTTGTAVLLTPITTYGPDGSNFFVAEAVVPDHFSEFYLGASPLTPLPVELTQFTATAVGPAAVRLAWATATERNSAAFEVERSTDGRTFAAIGTLAAAGNSSSPRRYELPDTRLPAGAATLYYRLRQVDADGTASYSPVRTVAVAAGPAVLALFPNPTTDRAATLTGAQPGAVVTVYDAIGRLVLAATANAAGTAELVLPVGYATGVYVVRTGPKALRLAVE